MFSIYRIVSIYITLLTFDSIEIGKSKFHYSKYPININNVSIEKMIFDKVSLGKIPFKYFIVY